MFGHNYAVPGTYEITMVVAGRRPVFGKIVGSTKTGGEAPHLNPSMLGQAVLNNEIPKIHHYYPMVDIWQVCLMPDHLHLIVRINAPLPKGKHLGIIIGAFKGGVSRAWWQLTGMAEADATATAAAAGSMLYSSLRTFFSSFTSRTVMLTNSSASFLMSVAILNPF